MDNYLLLKMLHILSATVLIGTGSGIAFFMWMAYRSNNTLLIAMTAKHVVLADWIFTAPAVVVQLITGIALMQLLGYSFSSVWFLVVICLFVFIGLCWLPVVLIQYKIKALAQSRDKTAVLSRKFKLLMRYWVALGIPAFISIVILVWLMIFKPLAII